MATVMRLCSDFRKEIYFCAEDLTRFWKTAGVLPVVSKRQHFPCRPDRGAPNGVDDTTRIQPGRFRNPLFTLVVGPATKMGTVRSGSAS
jgi:hypothetical protein